MLINLISSGNPIENICGFHSTGPSLTSYVNISTEILMYVIYLKIRVYFEFIDISVK